MFEKLNKRFIADTPEEKLRDSIEISFSIVKLFVNFETLSLRCNSSFINNNGDTQTL